MSLPVVFTPRIVVSTTNSLAEEYLRVRMAEAAAQQALEVASTSTQAAEERAELDLVSVRVLGQMMLQTESEEALFHLSRAIQSSVDNVQLLQLGKFCLRFFVKIFYQAKGPEPPDYEEPMRSIEELFEEERDMRQSPEEREAMLVHSAAREKALERDGRRCVLTGAYSKRDSSAAGTEHNRLTLQKAVKLNTVHIIPEGFKDFHKSSIEHAEDRGLLELFGVEVDNDETMNRRSTMRTMLKIFGWPDLTQELRGMDIHRLENILTMNIDDEDSMDTLLLWFEATGSLNEYNVCVLKRQHRPLRPVYPPQRARVVPVEKVVFPGTAELPAPSPMYLALHAAFCRIANFSGAAALLAKTERKMDRFRDIAVFEVSHAALDTISMALELGHMTRRRDQFNNVIFASV